jgi:hypothetical protein
LREWKKKMLNLSRDEDLLTQGQTPADRVLANPNQARPVEGQPGAVPPSAQAGSPSAPTVDPQGIARRVYDLMKQDLRITNERRGFGR